METNDLTPEEAEAADVELYQCCQAAVAAYPGAFPGVGGQVTTRARVIPPGDFTKHVLLGVGVDPDNHLIFQLPVIGESVLSSNNSGVMVAVQVLVPRSMLKLRSSLLLRDEDPTPLSKAARLPLFLTAVVDKSLVPREFVEQMERSWRN